MLAQIAFDATWNIALTLGLIGTMAGVVRQWTKMQEHQEDLDSRLLRIEKHTEKIPVLETQQRSMEKQLDGIDARLQRLEAKRT